MSLNDQELFTAIYFGIAAVLYLGYLVGSLIVVDEDDFIDYAMLFMMNVFLGAIVAAVWPLGLLVGGAWFIRKRVSRSRGETTYRSGSFW